LKSKKLFAILTLMAFMMTLLPMAAFGAMYDNDSPYSASRTTVTVTDSNLENFFDIASPTDDAAKFVLTFKTSSGAAVTPGDLVDFTIQTTSDLAAGWIDLNGNKAYDAGEEFDDQELALMDSNDGLYLDDDVTLNADSQVWIFLGATKAISYQVKFFAGEDAYARQLGKTRSVNVELEDGAITLEVWDDDRGAGNQINEDGSTYDKDLGAGTDFQIDAGEGFELRAQLPSDEEDVEVTFYQKEEGGSWVAIGKSDTDEDGEAVLWVDAEKAATYFFKAKSSDADSTEERIKVVAADADTVTLKSDNGKKLAVKKNGLIEFFVKDEFGNAVAGETLDIDVKNAPADSDLEDQTYTATSAGPRGIAELTFKPDEIGKYTLVAESRTSGRKATIDVEAVDFDKVESLAFELNNMDGEEVTTLARAFTPATSGTNEVDEQAGTLKVFGVNDAGAKVELDVADLTFASSNGVHVKLGAGATDPNDITLNKDAAGTYQITVYYAEDNVIGVYDLKVVGGVNALNITPVVDGKKATVTIQYVDKNGDNTYTTNKGLAVPDETYTVTVPAGLTVTDNKKINDRGTGSFVVTATEYGTYPVTILTSNKKIAKTFELTFGVPEEEKTVIGAKSVTMFIGAKGYVQDGAAKVMDVAPFIKDDRTFVPVRYLAEAFGATADWNEATQTVTLTRADMTLTIIIGQSAITKVADGVTTIVTADVPAFIMDGRTVLPFRAVGEAFGAEVSYDAATQAVSFAQ